jgi:O-succinylbenzoic acid--CoA ligase
MLDELLDLPEAKRLLAGCKVILLGGAPLSLSERKRFLELGLPVWIGYGSSELCSHISLGPLSNIDGGSGFPLEGVKLHFDVHGRIGAEFSALYLGYCGEAERTDGAVFWSSDRGELLSSTGELVVLGRADRVIISGGEKIDPRYIEIVVTEQLDAIGKKNCRCIALGFPHPKWGERPVLFIETKSQALGDFPGSQDTELELENLAKEIVDRYLPTLLRPEIIIAVEKFSLTGPGKIALGELRTLYAKRVAT